MTAKNTKFYKVFVQEVYIILVTLHAVE
jgi:hypothetical protein